MYEYSFRFIHQITQEEEADAPNGVKYEQIALKTRKTQSRLISGDFWGTVQLASKTFQFLA